MNEFSHRRIRTNSWIRLLVTIAIILLAASALSLFNIRIDLTEDKRFTLSGPTREILSDLENDIYIQVYLDGEIPIPLKRLRRSVMELLEEFRIASDRRVDYEFINPSEGENEAQRLKKHESLIAKGLAQINIMAGDNEGGSTQKPVFPGMLINYNGIEVPVNFLRNDPMVSSEQNILHSSEGLEYELIQTISTLTSDSVYRVAFIEGHLEMPEIETADLTLNLARFFTIDRGTIGGKPGILDQYAAVVIAGPESEFSEPDKFVIDQYVMNGGKVLWLIDEVYVNADSLTMGATAALYRPLNLEDQLFRYGARVNPEIVQDAECQIIRLKVVGSGGRQQFVNVPWIYNPLLTPSPGHPLTRNLNRVRGVFSGHIDTVGLDPAIKKTVLLSTSGFTRTVAPPVVISLKESEYLPDKNELNRSHLPVAVLLEGVFPSAFRNRSVSGMKNSTEFRSTSRPTRMIVVADADIIRNEVSRSGYRETPIPLGLDRVNGVTYGNRDFLVNCLNYLVDDKGIMQLRSRELKIRLLDNKRVRSEKLKWQLINIISPVLIVILAGLTYNFFRKRKYQSSDN